MWKRIEVILVILAVVVPLAAWVCTAQDGHIPAAAKLCGNYQISSSQKLQAFLNIQKQGCENVTFVLIDNENDRWLVYGTKILIGE